MFVKYCTIAITKLDIFSKINIRIKCKETFALYMIAVLMTEYERTRNVLGILHVNVELAKKSKIVQQHLL